jgi:hypothetical protein
MERIGKSLRIISLVIALLWAAGAWAQGGTVTNVRHGTTLPVTCNPNTGAIFFLTVASPTIGLYACTATNTWTLGGGAGGGSTFPITIGGTVFSGGIPYFSSTTVESSSALLTLNGVLLGGGSGGSPTVTSADSTTTHALFATAGAPAFRAIATTDVPTLNQSTTGNAATATALAALPTPCSAGQAPTGVLANGNSTGCVALFNPAIPGTIGGTTPGAGIFTSVSIPADGTHPMNWIGGGNTTLPTLGSNQFGLFGPALATFTSFSFQVPNAIPTTNHLISCVVTGTNCVLSDSGETAALSGTSAGLATATTAGTCATNTTAIAGAATTMVAMASPVSTPGVGSEWSAFVSSAGNVTIIECAVAASAGGTIAFNIRVIP